MWPYLGMLQKSIIPSANEAQFFLSPPWSFFVMLPLGLFGFDLTCHTFLVINVLLALCLIKNKRDFAAGVCLLPLTVKPQISYMAFILLLVWVIKERRWKVFTGFLSISIITLQEFSSIVLVY